MVTVHPQNHSGLIRLSRSRSVRVSHDGRDGRERKKIEQDFPRKGVSYWNSARNSVAG